MSEKLTREQRIEIFAQTWHITGNKSEAYRKAYPSSLNWKDKTVHNKAFEFSQDGDVMGRFKQLQKETAENHGVTVASLIKELEEARQSALCAESPQSSAAVSATMGKAKLCGLDVPKQETAKPTPIYVNIGVEDAS